MKTSKNSLKFNAMKIIADLSMKSAEKTQILLAYGGQVSLNNQKR